MEDKKKELTASLEAKASELSKKHNCKVTPILFYLNKNTDDPIVGYVKEPSRLQKIRILDKSGIAGDFTAGAEMLDGCLIKEDSDPRIYSESQEYDEVYLGALYECQQLIRIAIGQFKKN